MNDTAGDKRLEDALISRLSQISEAIKDLLINYDLKTGLRANLIDIMQMANDPVGLLK